MLQCITQNRIFISKTIDIALPGCNPPSSDRNTTFAYASQSPWLFNDSLRANVLFGRPWKKGRYQRVLAACDLKKDVELLGPDGDRTAIGEQGSVLSGGQRQRVAVARALYSDANCVILVSGAGRRGAGTGGARCVCFCVCVCVYVCSHVVFPCVCARVYLKGCW